jgi:lipoprotein-anchoring transpeptidase ErfK/SrfK
VKIRYLYSSTCIHFPTPPPDEVIAMPFRSRLFATVLAFVTLAGAALPAQAQSFFSFFWGGGSRTEVSFPASVAPGQIIVSFGDRKLYWVYARGSALSYPIAIPREQSRWQGVTSVSDKRVNPGWTPTPAMRKENPSLPAHVPGGHPQNPLGVRALYLGASMYRIHGTDAPWTIGEAVSKGCIRMTNEDVLDLYPRVPVGTRVTVTWKKYKS